MSKSYVIQGTFAGCRVHGPAVAQQAPEAQTARPAGGGYATPVPEGLFSRRGSGKPLPDEVRQKMESALGASFSDVRIHVGPEASSVGALAFTHGSDIFFAAGQYDPHTAHGQRLLGHELTHVVQQRAGRVRNPFGSGVAVVQDHALEAEADRLGMKAAAMQLEPRGDNRAGEHDLESVQAKEDDERMRGFAPHVRAAFGGSGQAKPASRPNAPVAASHPVAPHVQAATGQAPQARSAGLAAGVQGKPVGNTSQPAAAHVQKAIQPRSAAGAPNAAQAKPGENYQVVLGAYLHQTGPGERLPEDLAGHTFVSIQGPGGDNQTWGFSPANLGRYDLDRDLPKLKTGVQGKLHADGGAFGKPGVRTRSFSVSKEQAQAASAKVAEYQTRKYPFSLSQRQCSTFAYDVLKAAKVEAPAEGGQVPRAIYSKL